MNDNINYVMKKTQTAGKRMIESESINSNVNYRLSPSLSASLYNVGEKNIGSDGKLWKVVEDRNGIKEWRPLRERRRKKSKNTKKSRKSRKSRKSKKSKKSKKSNTYKQLLSRQVAPIDLYDIKYVNQEELKNIADRSEDRIKKIMDGLFKFVDEIHKIGKNAYIVPLPLSKGIYWEDYSDSYMDHTFKDPNWYKKPFLLFIVYMNETGDKIIDRSIDVGFTKMNMSEKKQIIELLDKYVPKHYEWSGKNTVKISIHFNEFDNDIDIDSLKDDDVYPLLHVYLVTKKEINLFKDNRIIEIVIKKISTILNRKENDDSVNYGYAINEVDLNFFSVSTDLYDKVVNDIRRYLNELKDIFDTYELNYYLDNQGKPRDIISGKIGNDVF